MQDRLLQLIFRLARRRGVAVIVVAALITVALGAFIPGLSISTSQMDLLPSDHPVQARYIDFMEEFGAADNLVVVLEGEPALLRGAAEDFAAALRAETEWVKSVFYRVDLDALLERAPLYMSVEELERGVDALKGQRELLTPLSQIKSLSQALGFVADRFDPRSQAGVPLESVPALLAAMRWMMEEWGRFIDQPGYVATPLREHLLAASEASRPLAEDGGFLLSHDRRLLFMFVQPTRIEDDVSFLRPLDRALRAACARVFERRPELAGKIKVAFTGMPAHHLTEAETVFSDVGRAGLVAVGLVVLILLVGFRSLRKVLLAVVPLALGMVMTLGIARLIFGHLNLISAAFLAVLFGIGIDFGIYLLRRTEEELGNGREREEAVRLAVVRSGRGILTGGLTTGLAFLAVTASDFVGFSELGLIAGIGVLVVLVVTLLLLPALLLRVEIAPRSYDLDSLVARSGGAGHRSLVLGISALALLLSLLSLFALQRVRFDYNALALLPADTESTIYQIRMQEESDFQMSFAAVTRDSLDELAAVVRRMEGLPSVSRIESLAMMIPEQQPEKLALLQRYRPFLEGLKVERTGPAAGADEYLAQLERLLERVEGAQELAFSGGQKELVVGLDALLGRLEELIERFEGEDTAATLARTQAFETSLFDSATELIGLIQRWLDARPVTADSFPPEVLRRFKSDGGQYVAYVFPRESIWDLGFLDRFVAEVSAVDPTVTGFPVTHRVNARLAAVGLRQSLLYALSVLVLLLAFDFRRAGEVLLALVPLGLGMLWLQGALVLLDQRYNLANMAALPLLLGLGVVYGVHMVHRWREQPDRTAFAVTATTGKGVAFSALTTISGIASIAFARHNGVATFGVVLLLGISLCLLTALFVLPALIDLLSLWGRKGEAS